MKLKIKTFKMLRRMCIDLLDTPHLFDMKIEMINGCGCLGGHGERKGILNPDSWTYSLIENKSDFSNDFSNDLLIFLFSSEYGYISETPTNQILDCIGRIDALLAGDIEWGKGEQLTKEERL